MGEYHIHGGKRLSGDIRITGGKNAVLPILASAVLNNGKSVIHNCPLISDTFISKELLEAIGCKVQMEGSTMVIDSSSANRSDVPEQLVSEMRSSIIFMGGLLGRFNKAKISYPGGCELGQRPINLHLKALRAMGASITEEHGFILCRASRLRGTRISLDFPSVGASQNIMLAAVLADGETIISNAAREPEMLDMQRFLNGMGADITGAGTDTIRIYGVQKLRDVEHTIMPDRIVAGTYLTAAAITKGEIRVTDIEPEHLYPITSKLSEAGCLIRYGKKEIHLKGPEKIKPIEHLQTHPHPGFPTDMQPQIMTLLSLAEGTSIITETIFESRNKHVAELARMGADITLSRDGTTAFIKGVQRLNSSVVRAMDLRGGAALILAGLSAEGLTVVKDSRHVERGYEKIESALKSLGADIQYHYE